MDDMPRTLPFIQREKSRHGKMMWYFRRARGERLRLPDAFGSPEFMAAYNAALNGWHIETPRPHTPKSGTVAWLVARYRESSDWASRSPATRRQREYFYAAILKTGADIPFSSVTSRHIREGRERRKDRPAHANNYLKAMRALFKWAAESEFTATDPSRDVKFIRAKTEGFLPWTPEDIAAFRARWPAGTRERLAFMIGISTGLRRGDAARLGRQHVKDGVIYLKAEKTGCALSIPVSQALAEEISRHKAAGLSFIATATGQPMTKESFGNFFRDACKAAGLEKKSFHGLRKSLAIKGAQSGMTEMEMQGFFGWSNGQMSQVYTRKANREMLAKTAGIKLEGVFEEQENPEPLGAPPEPKKLP